MSIEVDPLAPPKPHALRADAVLVPVAYRAAVVGPDRLVLYKTEFSAILGGGPVYSSFILPGMTMAFLRPDPTECLNFSSKSSRQDRSRYAWTDRGDGVLYGVKVEGADDAE